MKLLLPYGNIRINYVYLTNICNTYEWLITYITNLYVIFVFKLKEIIFYLSFGRLKFVITLNNNYMSREFKLVSLIFSFVSFIGQNVWIEQNIVTNLMIFFYKTKES